jgi:hypothetical protein
MFVYKEYPRMLYHPELGQCAVDNTEQMAMKIAEGWDITMPLAVEDGSDGSLTVSADPVVKPPPVVGSPIAIGVEPDPEPVVAGPEPKPVLPPAPLPKRVRKYKT